MYVNALVVEPIEYKLYFTDMDTISIVDLKTLKRKTLIKCKCYPGALAIDKTER